jgi:hypothetical protein
VLLVFIECLDFGLANRALAQLENGHLIVIRIEKLMQREEYPLKLFGQKPTFWQNWHLVILISAMTFRKKQLLRGGGNFRKWLDYWRGWDGGIGKAPFV